MKILTKITLSLIATTVLSSCTTVDSALESTKTFATKVANTVDEKVIKNAELKSNVQHAAAVTGDAVGKGIKIASAKLTELLGLLRGRVDKVWGSKNTELPSRNRYVKYTDDYKTRTIVDFRQGFVQVQTIVDDSPEAHLRTSIVATLLLPDDPGAVDLFSDKAVTIARDQEPYFHGLIKDNQGQWIDTQAQAENFADHLLATSVTTKPMATANGVSTPSRTIQFSMVNNFVAVLKRKYDVPVTEYASKYRVDPNLVHAIIRAESNYNPYAVSAVPAYGLMQLVPATGARDAYKKVTGNNELPSEKYLFSGKQNIELGVAYLNILAENYLKAVSNPQAREYCVISAYNTGAGNVLRTFAKNNNESLSKINGYKPEALYTKLVADLPMAETRQYLAKVVAYRNDNLKETVAEAR